MSVFDTLKPLLQDIPEQEHAYVRRMLQYQLTVLALMPESQRYTEYSKSEMAMLHYERLNLEYKETQKE
jgi:hypothetical protein